MLTWHCEHHEVYNEFSKTCGKQDYVIILRLQCYLTSPNVSVYTVKLNQCFIGSPKPVLGMKIKGHSDIFDDILITTSFENSRRDLSIDIAVDRFISKHKQTTSPVLPSYRM